MNSGWNSTDEVQQAAGDRLGGDADRDIQTVLSFVVLLGALQLNQDTQWFKVFVETEDEVLESFKLPIKTAPAGVVAIDS